jgi:hypothetical protein
MAISCSKLPQIVFARLIKLSQYSIAVAGEFRLAEFFYFLREALFGRKLLAVLP